MRINTRISQRLSKINPSLTLALTSQAKKMQSDGIEVVNFAAGEPDFDTPPEIKKAAIEAINSGFTKYTPTTGFSELKKAICEKFKKDNFLEYSPEQIVVSCGAKHSIFNAILAIIDKGEEVLIPSPYWVSYPEMVKLAEGIPKFIKTSSKNNFKFTLPQLEQQITAKTKLLILNSPSNPTGAVYSEAELKDIARVCVKKRLFVISDEIYENIIFSGSKHCSLASFNNEIYQLSITVNGVSKSYAMTGWRIGYLAAPVDIADSIAKLQDHSTSCPCSISQKAALAALQFTQESVHKNRLIFEERRDLVVQRLKNIQKLSFIKPEGAFYIFCDISRTGLDADEFAKHLLAEAYVCVIPGRSFGESSFIRISFACDNDEINKGFDRIEQWLK